MLAALDSAGLTENTFVFITTDHGIAYPLMKCNLTAHGTGVLLLMRGPMNEASPHPNPLPQGERELVGMDLSQETEATESPLPLRERPPRNFGAGEGQVQRQKTGFYGGEVIDALVSHIDIFPTLCEAAGLPRPDWLEGVSLIPLAAGAASVRDAVFAEVNWHAAPEPMRSVRTVRHNYIRRFAPHTGPVLPNCDDSISKTAMRKAGWDSRPQVAEELYDLVFDPNEACNRTCDPAYAATLADMRDRLKNWMEKTNDPLLTGRIEPWPGARSGRVTDDSPQGEWWPAEAMVIHEA